MKLNPSAVVFWVLCACIGFLISTSFYGAVAGLAVGLGLTLVADAIS